MVEQEGHGLRVDLHPCPVAEVADPQIAERQATDGKSIQYWFTQHGLHFRPGLKHHEPRIAAVSTLLDGKLKFMAHCEQTIVAVQQYSWEEPKFQSDMKDKPERPQKKNDHLVDALAYVATIITPKPRVGEKPKQKTHDDYIWERVLAQVKGNRSPAPSPRALI